MNLQEARSLWQQHRREFEARGISWAAGASPPVAYIPDGFGRDYGMAMDALPTLSTDPNAGIPVMLNTFIDPQIFEILFAEMKAVEICGEVAKGDWLMKQTMFPVVEHTGEVSSYDDYAETGRAGVNTGFPQVQSYLFQTMKEYGEYEVEVAGLGRISYVSEVDRAAADILARAQNTTYHFGVAGLQNYGLLNNPLFSPALTPSTKAAGGVGWFTSTGAVNAQANEVYNDIVALVAQAISQTDGIANAESKMTLALSPQSKLALTFTNTFNVNVKTLLLENFPKMRVVDDILYGKLTSTNPTGNAAGNLVQLIIDEMKGQKTMFNSYNVKLRAHPIVRAVSSWKQKMTSGTWGNISRMPMGVASMVGV